MEIRYIGQVVASLLLASLISVRPVAAATQSQPAKPPDSIRITEPRIPSTETERERAQLAVKDYRNLCVVSEDLGQNKAGLTGDAVRTKTELRLRSAGIRPLAEVDCANRQWWLHVTVALDPNSGAYTMSLEFIRHGTVEGWDLLVITWHRGRFGNGNDANHVLGGLDGLLDQFLNAYLKANQDNK